MFQSHFLYPGFCLGLYRLCLGSIHCSQVDGGSNLSITVRWSQKLSYQDGEFTLNIPYSFPEFVTPVGKKMSKKEKIQLNVNAGPGTEVLCKTISHPLKVQL